MSTSSPRPPQSGLSPFKDQTPFDPYLPSSPDDEQLQKITASGVAESERLQQQQQHHHHHTGIGRGPASSSGGGAGIATLTHVDSTLGGGYNGMNRTDTFGLDGFEPQGFDNNLLLDENFASLPGNYDVNDMSLFRNSSFKRTDTGRTDEPQSASTSKGTDFSRRSTGLATHSSQLMSPVLTDAASPDPGDPPGSAGRPRLLGGGEMSRGSSNSTANPGQYSTVAERTPALTASSYELTPNMADQAQPLFPPTTPSIQVDYHKRGDSPARSQGQENLIQKRRRGSRSSSLLAVHTEGTSEDGEAEEERRERRDGLDPAARSSDAIASLDDQAQQSERDDANERVSHWLSVSGGVDDPNPASAPMGPRQYLKPGGRRRAASNSNPSDLPADAKSFSRNLQADTHAQTLGPGLLINELSDDDDDDVTGSYVESAPPSVDGHEAAVKAEELDAFPPLQVASPEQEAHPWADPIFMPSHPDVASQPGTSNAAIQRFMKRAHDIETASRVATWGTIQRRMSDGDLHMERVFGSGGLLARLSISKERDRDRTERDREEWRGFRETMERAADKIRPRRTNSTSKRKGSEPSRPPPENAPFNDKAHARKDSSASSKHDRKESFSKMGSHLHLQRSTSGPKRPKSPRINTGFAAAMQVVTLGAGSISPTASMSTTWRDKAKEKLGFHSRQHSESPEALRVSSPPVIAHAPPPVEPPKAADAEDEADGDLEEGVTMKIEPTKSNIIPTFEGFKAHVREANPRLPNYLVERLGQEQLRRYKKLVSFKVEHTKARELGTCRSGAFCAARDGQPRYFTAKNMPKPVPGDDDDDEDAVADGIVSEAQFPAGLPMPPAKRLPAEFECPLCFQVKKFYKPSDWSKHVHEDLQPFTCTFQHCPDPKSFKRKADWVRHENERHRQLEWWQCTEDGCSHLCYRRDNFVQHLVREHKLPEPKAKNTRPGKPAVRGPAKTKPKAKGIVNIHDVPLEERVLYMVEVCRRENSKDPLTEPCRFCGNHCNSFKKLTVHLARHMESLSLPVLELVKAKEVSADTIISPIDVKLTQQGLSPGDQRSGFDGTLADHAYPNTGMDLNIGPGIGMTPMMTGPGFQSGSYQTANSWNPNSTYLHGEVDSAWHGEQTSSGIYNPAVSAPYPHFPNTGTYMAPGPLPNANLFNPLNSGQASRGYGQMGMDAPQPNFPAGHYLAADAATANEMGLTYNADATDTFTQPPSGGMYGTAAAQAPRHPSSEQQRRYFHQYG